MFAAYAGSQEWHTTGLLRCIRSTNCNVIRGTTELAVKTQWHTTGLFRCIRPTNCYAIRGTAELALLELHRCTGLSVGSTLLAGRGNSDSDEVDWRYAETVECRETEFKINGKRCVWQECKTFSPGLFSKIQIWKESEYHQRMKDTIIPMLYRCTNEPREQYRMASCSRLQNNVSLIDLYKSKVRQLGNEFKTEIRQNWSDSKRVPGKTKWNNSTAQKLQGWAYQDHRLGRAPNLG